MTKEERYEQLTAQIKSLIEGETDAVSVMANVAAAIQQEMGFFWTGFYLDKGDCLHLGPFQGPVACMRIAYGRGVCGAAFEQRQTIIVPDVGQFPGHIACSSLSQSEIVVPIFNDDGEPRGVLDIDSRELSTFDTTDKHYLEQICTLLGRMKL